MAGSPAAGRQSGPAKSHSHYDSYSPKKDWSPDRRNNRHDRERSPEMRGSGRTFSPIRARSPVRGDIHDSDKHGTNESYHSHRPAGRSSRDGFARSISPQENRARRRDSSKDSPVHRQPPPAPVGEKKSSDVLSASLAEIFEQLIGESVDKALLKSKQQDAATVLASATANEKRSRKNADQFPTSIEVYGLMKENAARAEAAINNKMKKKEEMVKTAASLAAAKIIPMLLEAAKSTPSQISNDKQGLRVETLEKRCQTLQTQYEEQKKKLDEIKSGNRGLEATVQAQKNIIDKQASSLEKLITRLSELEKKSDVAGQLQKDIIDKQASSLERLTTRLSELEKKSDVAGQLQKDIIDKQASSLERLTTRLSELGKKSDVADQLQNLETKSLAAIDSLRDLKQWQEKATADMRTALEFKADAEKPLKELEQAVTGFHKRVVVLEDKSKTHSQNLIPIAKDVIKSRDETIPMVIVRLGAVEARTSQLESSPEALQKENSATIPAPSAVSHDYIEQRLKAVEENAEVSCQQMVDDVGSMINTTKEYIERINKSLSQQIANLSDRQDSISISMTKALETRLTQLNNQLSSSFAHLDDPRFTSFTSQAETNAAAVDNLESRYNNIFTQEIYQAMVSQFLANELPQLNQLQQHVPYLTKRIGDMEEVQRTRFAEFDKAILDIQAAIVKGARAPAPLPINGTKEKQIGNNRNYTHSPSPNLTNGHSTNGHSTKSPRLGVEALRRSKKRRLSRESEDLHEFDEFDEISVRVPSDEDD